MDGFKGVTPAFKNDIFKRAKGSGAEVIKRKGGAGWAVGATIAEVIHAMVLDSRRILPISSMQGGCAYGIRNICISVPTIVGSNGWLSHEEIELWPKEKQGLINSANTLKDTLAKVQ